MVTPFKVTLTSLLANALPFSSNKVNVKSLSVFATVVKALALMLIVKFGKVALYGMRGGFFRLLSLIHLINISPFPALIISERLFYARGAAPLSLFTCESCFYIWSEYNSGCIGYF